MPYEEIKKIPEIYKIYERQRMGANAATEPLTSETYTKINFPQKKSAVQWIQQQQDHGKIFIIRNRKDEMLESYCWKHDRNIWDTINRSGYFGNFKIGNPTTIACPFCHGTDRLPCKQHKHPCYKKPQQKENI